MRKRIANTQKREDRFAVHRDQQPNSYHVIDLSTERLIATFHGDRDAIQRAKDYADMGNKGKRKSPITRVFGLLTIVIGGYTLYGSFLQAWQTKSWIVLGLISMWFLIGFYIAIREEA